MSGDGFLSRWSRLKTEHKEPEAIPPLAGVGAEVSARDGQGGDPPAPGLPPPEPTPLELPSIDSLTKDSDFSAFLQAGVPEELKRAALSKLWASDPLFSQPEIYDLHMEDYSFPTIPELVKTAWRAGQGIVEELTAAPECASLTDDPEKTHNNTEDDEPDTPGS